MTRVIPTIFVIALSTILALQVGHSAGRAIGDTFATINAAVTALD